MSSLKEQVDAFKQLLGVETLPKNGKQALIAVSAISSLALSTARPTPHLQQLVESCTYARTTTFKPYTQRFVDLSTGIRARFLEWPTTGDDVILLLHSIARCADAWIPLASRLSDRGYKIYALDFRGHGGTDWSPSGRYSASQLAEDVQAFIVAEDLYTHPVAVVGWGLGAAVGITLVSAAPNLVGAVAAVEFGLPPELVKPGDGGECTRACGSQSSAELLPWWSFWPGQGATFSSAADCAALLSNPLINAGPSVMPSLLQQAAVDSAGGASFAGGDASPAELRRKQELLAGLSRPPSGVAQDAVDMVGPASFSSSGCFDESGAQKVELKLDPAFFFSFDVAAMVRGLARMQAHFMVLHGERSGMVPPAAASALAAIPRNPASVSLVSVPQGGHALVIDAHRDVHDALVRFLEGPAILAFEAAAGQQARAPETLGLRPLPQYASLEEAAKALGPRQIPSKDGVEEELRKLRLEAGGSEGSSDEEEGGAGQNSRTALSQNPADYFGFVG